MGLTAALRVGHNSAWRRHYSRCYRFAGPGSAVLGRMARQRDVVVGAAVRIAWVTAVETSAAPSLTGVAANRIAAAVAVGAACWMILMALKMGWPVRY